MSWYLEAFEKYAGVGGRSRRKEYWYFMLFNLIVGLVLVGIDLLLGTFSPSSNIGLLSGIYSLAVIIPSLALSVRRLHDIDRTGWWVLINSVPPVGSIVLLVFAVTNGTPGGNRYGPNPRGPPAGWFEVRPFGMRRRLAHRGGAERQGDAFAKRIKQRTYQARAPRDPAPLPA